MPSFTTIATITELIQNATIAATKTSGDFVPADELWIVISGFVFAFVLAFGIGANVVANSFATSVGAKVLTLLQACVLASVFETAGAVLIGAKVSDTIRMGIIDVTLFAGQEKLLLVGNVAALAGACIWLLIATLFKMPVSGTHSIVGATLGYALVAFKGAGIQWTQLLLIASSWLISPVLAGLASVTIFAIIRRFILNKDEPLEAGLLFLPFIYALTIIINVFSIFYSGTPTLGFDKIPLWGCIILTMGIGLIVGVLVRLIVVPMMRAKVLAECDADVHLRTCKKKTCSGEGGTSQNDRKKSSTGEVAIEVTELKQKKSLTYPIMAPDLTKAGVSDTLLCQLPLQDKKCKDYGTVKSEKTDPEKQESKLKACIQDRTETRILFTFLQILTAVFGSFAHGGNGVSIAIGPLVGIWLVSTEGSVYQDASSPVWLLAIVGVGICAGLLVLGRRVIETLGQDLTKVTPSSGFCIELGTAITVLIASNIGIPISTTHCKVGSVVFTGRFRSRENVNWKIFRNIVLAWVVTLPVSGLLSAGIFAGLRELVWYLDR